LKTPPIKIGGVFSFYAKIGDMLEFTKKEKALFKRLNTPAKVQDFLNTIPINFEKNGVDTLKSPVKVMREWNAHCIEGAILGAYILSLHGYKPLLLNMRAVKPDFEHVIAPFKMHGLWGALSKTNHAVERYREPIYKSIRELIMSYFNEYYLENGVKTLRSYSAPLNLNNFGKDWVFEEKDLWKIDSGLDKVRYVDIAPKNAVKNYRLADPIEIKLLKLTEWKK
jgi:hypothetical protein